MHITPGVVPFRSTKRSGRGSIGVAVEGDAEEGTAVVILFGLDGPALPQVQCECKRRAGLGNVLYVEPREVYLKCTISLWPNA